MITIYTISGGDMKKYVDLDYEYEKFQFWGYREPFTVEQIREAYYAAMVYWEAKDLLDFHNLNPEQKQIAEKVRDEAWKIFDGEYRYLSFAPDAIEELNSPP